MPVSDLADELGIPPHRLLRHLSDMGITVLTSFSTVPPRVADGVRELLQETRPAPDDEPRPDAGSDDRTASDEPRADRPPAAVEERGPYLRAPSTGAVDPPAFRDLLAVLRMQRWVVVVAVLLAVGIALAVTVSTPPTYTAEAAVLVRPLPTAGTGEPELNMATEVELIASEVVAERVRDALGLSVDAAALAERVSSDQPEGTEIIEISMSSRMPQAAANLTGTYVDEYLAFRREQAIAAVATIRSDLEQEVETLQERLTDLNEQIAASPDPSGLQSQAAAVTTRILERQLELAALPSDPDPGTILRRASVPSEPSGPDLLQNLLIGAIAGATLGVSVAILRDRFDQRVHHVSELEDLVGAPMLTAIPSTSRIPWRHRAQLVARDSAAGEAFRVLAMDVLALSRRHRTTTIALTGVRSSGAVTETTANLGVVLAAMGRRVVLISAEVRDGRLDALFDVDGQPGLADVVTGVRALSDTPTTTEVDDLRLLRTGTPDRRSPAIVDSPAFDSTVGALERTADLVLIDTAPVDRASEGLAIARSVGDVLLVLDGAHLDRSSLRFTRRQIEQVGGRILGCVVTGRDPARITRDL